MTTARRIVFITGANQGIGFETARDLLLASSDYHVIIGSRDLARGEEAASHLQSLSELKGTVSCLQIDVTDDQSVDAAAATIAAQYGRLDVLVNNAGVVAMTEPPQRDALRKVLDVNVVGTLSTTEACLDLLRKSSDPRLVFVSSSMGSITHASSPESPFYRHHATEYRTSKAALNMMMVMYWARLKGEGIKVFGADPGLCATNFGGNPAALRSRGAAEPDEGGRRVAAVVKGEKDEHAGKVLGVYGISPF